MKANVKAWQDTFNEKGMITDVDSLRALNAILFGPVWEIKELTTDIAEKMAEEWVNHFFCVIPEQGTTANLNS